MKTRQQSKKKPQIEIEYPSSDDEYQLQYEDSEDSEEILQNDDNQEEYTSFSKYRLDYKPVSRALYMQKQPFKVKKSGPKNVQTFKQPEDFFFGLFPQETFDMIQKYTNDTIQQKIQQQNNNNNNLNISQQEEFQYPEADDYFQTQIDENEDITQKNINKSERKHQLPLKITKNFEIKRAIGIMYNFGVHKYNNMRSYWSKDQLLKQDYIKNTLSRDRFLQIYQNLTFHDEEERKISQDMRFFHTKEFRQKFINNTLKYYTPFQNLAPDELMIKFLGFDKDKQYIPSKPQRFGYKAQALCDEQGVLLNFLLYSKYNYKDDGHKDIPFAQKVILDLVKPFNFKGFNLFMDSLYTSPQLLIDLKQNGFNAAGTIQIKYLYSVDNQKMKEKLKKIEPDECQFYQDKGKCAYPLLLSASQQKFKKVIRVLSNYHSVKTNFVNRTLDSKERAQIEKEDPEKIVEYDKEIKNLLKKKIKVPQQQKDYCSYMGGVDHFDQMNSYYTQDHKSKKKYFRINIAILEFHMINSFLIYKQTMEKRKRIHKSLLEYRIHVIKILMNTPEDFIPLKSKEKQSNFQQFRIKPNKNGYGGVCKLCTKTIRQRCNICSRFICKDDQEKHQIYCHY